MEGVLGTVLLVVLIALAASALYAVWVAVGAIRSTRESIERLDERLQPLLGHAEDTLSVIDCEVERVDGIVTQIEGVSESVTAATRVASEAVRGPLIRVVGIRGGLRGLASALRRR